MPAPADTSEGGSHTFPSLSHFLHPECRGLFANSAEISSDHGYSYMQPPLNGKCVKCRAPLCGFRGFFNCVCVCVCQALGFLMKW